MATEDRTDLPFSGPHASPGDDARARLRRREALRARRRRGMIEASEESLADDGPERPAPSVSASEDGRDVTAPSSPELPDAIGAAAGAQILAVAAALGIEPPLGTAPRPRQPMADDATRAAPPDATVPPVAAAAAESSPEAIAAEAGPSPALTSGSPPLTEVPGPAAGREQSDRTAARLEATLLDQLRLLEDSFRPEASHLPPATPLRAAGGARDDEPPAAPAPRSPFAPDPVRQRTYVDLREPAASPDRSAPDDAPWRKYLAGPGRSPRRPPPAPSSGRPVRRLPQPPPAAFVAAEPRGSGFRAMSLAALLGLGVGLGLLALMHPFVSGGSGPVVASAPLPAATDRVAAAAPAPPAAAPAAGTVAVSPGQPVGPALATLLADPPTAHGPAVISEPGAAAASAVASGAPAADVAATTAAAAPVASPPVIRPPPGTAVRVARVPDFDAAATGPLGYAPTVPSFDPVRRSLLDNEAGKSEPAEPPAARTARAEPPPTRSASARTAGPGRATINTFVNMRAKPDNAAPVVAILAEGLAVRVVSCDYWCEIEAGGKRGYVFKKFVSR